MRTAMVVGILLVLFTLQSGHPSIADDKVDKWAAGCVWIPENAAGSKWTYYCATDDPAKPQIDVAPGFTVLGGNADETKTDHDLENWLKNESKLTGEALTASGGVGRTPLTSTDDQNKSFVLPGGKEGVNPCVLMDGKHGGLNKKRDVPCVDVRADLLANPPTNPCLRLPSAQVAATQSCLRAHPVWRELAPPQIGDVPPCSGGVKSSLCPDSGVITTNAKEHEDDAFLTKPITFIREQSQTAVRITLMWWITSPDPLISENKRDCQPDADKPTDAEKAAARDKGYPCSRNTADFLTRYTNPFTYTLALACVVIAGLRLAYTRDVSSVRDVVKGTFTLILVTGSAVFVVNLAVKACQVFTNWIVVRGLDPDTTGYDSSERALQEAADRFAKSLESFNSIVLFLIAALIIIASNMVQYFYMTARLFFVIVLTGTLPLSASATSTAAGRNVFQKHISYLVAFIFVKPASMIIFVAGARLWAPPGYESLNMAEQFRGLFVLALVTLVGPATVRVVFALTGPAAGSSAANIGTAGAVLTLGARPVTGAANLLRHR
ncbi:hypothetical protein ACFRCG_21005 [Embleya sp. NPDC056575]|uniref:hypothetical protein n=1 Tax=unclassified Embleya TaxID=2699296 RepID=UPI0036834E63